LSGSASDGTEGMKAIKQFGGLTFAQDDSAKFTSMPHSAIAAGTVDFILSPKDMALELARLSKQTLGNNRGVKNGDEDLIDNNDPELKNILNQLHISTGVDFSVYKMNTIKRRIIRRMFLYKISLVVEYAKLLTENKEEIDILYQDLLINVTSFFRDTETHEYLKETLFPKLLQRKKNGEYLRLWVPACATGEEAYSLAIMLLEIQESEITNIPVQINEFCINGSICITLSCFNHRNNNRKLLFYNHFTAFFNWFNKLLLLSNEVCNKSINSTLLYSWVSSGLVGFLISKS
jgi:two-component system CheB/CheR fusion protein